MKRYCLIALMLLAFAPLSFGARAADVNGPFSGADLHSMCQSKSDVDYGYCAGYISAVAQTLLTQTVDGYHACNHGHVRSQQLVDTFSTWAEIFPDKLGDDAEKDVAAALARAFPCR